MRLTKSKKNSMLFGVCGGIADWLEWDPTIVRIGYVLASIFSAAFPGFLIYILLIFIMPESDE
ncbi:MAG TPA: PspC domain-containing protein [Clostridiales bacterium]|nr:PspC domain-containing protein [Clostridiales bacterium]